MAKYDVFGVGNALVDIQAQVEDSLLTDLKLDKGIMTLVDDGQQAGVLSAINGRPLHRCAGGSAANTVVALADFGGGAGADPVTIGSTARTDGTQRAFTETMLETVIDSCWNSGGNPDCIMAASFNKRVLNGFDGHADQVRHDATDKSIINAVSVYESDYGVMSVIPNRFQRSREVLVYEKEFWKLGVLRPMQNKEIARTGDAEKRQILIEYGLMACNEASSGGVFDLDDS